MPLLDLFANDDYKPSTIGEELFLSEVPQNIKLDAIKKQFSDPFNDNGIDYVRENFKYTLVEIFPKSDVGRERALMREAYWKEVLKTREYGYNDN